MKMKATARRKLTAFFAILCVVGLGGVFCAHAASTWYVATDGDDVNNDGKSWDHPFASIQKGLSSCVNKDTVIVSNGTYVIDSQLEITSQQVNLMSLTGNPADVIIDCRECRGIFSSSWKSSVVGVTVQNGRTDTAGAGIRLSTSALVSNCVVRSCSVVAGDNDANGGGIMCQQDSDVVGCLVENCIVSNASMTAAARDAKGGGIFNIGTVRGCTVRNCAVYSRNGHYGTSAGGGIYVESRIGTDDAQYPASVIDCTVYSNKVATLTKTYASEGGGIYISANGEIETPQVVSNCNVFANAAGWSGGGVSFYGKAQLIDCSIVSNATDNTLGLSDPQVDYMGGGGVFVRGTGGVVRRCLVEGNSCTITGSKQTQGGGGLRLSGTDISVADSVIRGNRSNKRGAALYFGATTTDCLFGGAVVSNCWIEANRADTSGVFAGYGVGGLQVVGCGIVSNEVSDSSVLYWYRTTDTSGVLFRNTLFAGNRNTGSGSNVYGLGLSANTINSPIAFEFSMIPNLK